MIFRYLGINMKSKWKVGFIIKGVCILFSIYLNLILVFYNICNSIEDIFFKYFMVFGIYG